MYLDYQQICDRSDFVHSKYENQKLHVMLGQFLIHGWLMMFWKARVIVKTFQHHSWTWITKCTWLHMISTNTLNGPLISLVVFQISMAYLEEKGLYPKLLSFLAPILPGRVG